jgi:hypothetical protein
VEKAVIQPVPQFDVGAEPDLRRWVERQVEFLAANRFVVASRPNGYRDNPLYPPLKKSGRLAVLGTKSAGGNVQVLCQPNRCRLGAQRAKNKSP